MFCFVEGRHVPWQGKLGFCYTRPRKVMPLFDALLPQMGMRKEGIVVWGTPDSVPSCRLPCCEMNNITCANSSALVCLLKRVVDDCATSSQLTAHTGSLPHTTRKLRCLDCRCFVSKGTGTTLRRQVAGSPAGRRSNGSARTVSPTRLLGMSSFRTRTFSLYRDFMVDKYGCLTYNDFRMDQLEWSMHLLWII